METVCQGSVEDSVVSVRAILTNMQRIAIVKQGFNIETQCWRDLRYIFSHSSFYNGSFSSIVQATECLACIVNGLE